MDINIAQDFEELIMTTAFLNITVGQLIMLSISCVLLYLAIVTSI